MPITHHDHDGNDPANHHFHHQLGYGSGTAWYKRGPEGEADPALTKATSTALSTGFRHLDCSEMYQTEADVGAAVSSSGLPRETLFIATKCHQGLASPGPKASLATSLKKLRVEYVDLYLLHTPWFASKSGRSYAGDADKAALQRAWREMEELRGAGLAREIGVSNFSPHHLEAVLETAAVRPAVNQVEFHAYLQRPDLLAFHRRHGIATAAYGPLVPLRGGAPGPLDGLLAGLAKKYAVSEAEVLLRWCVDQDVAALTTTAKEQRMSDYLRVAAFKMTPREVEEVAELGRKKDFRAFWNDKYDEKDFG